MSGEPTTPEELIMSILVESGLSAEDETTQQLAGKLDNIFQIGMSRVEITSRINEIEQAIGQNNLMMYGDKIQEDIANRNLIDPKVLQVRADQLKKMLGGDNDQG